MRFPAITPDVCRRVWAFLTHAPYGRIARQPRRRRLARVDPWLDPALPGGITAAASVVLLGGGVGGGGGGGGIPAEPDYPDDVGGGGSTDEAITIAVEDAFANFGLESWWRVVSGTWGESTQLRLTANGAGSPAGRLAGPAYAGDVYARAVCVASSPAQPLGVFTRGDWSLAASGYFAEINDAGARLLRLDAGVETVLGSWPVLWVPGMPLELRSSGADHALYVNAAYIGGASDATYAAGRVGIYATRGAVDTVWSRFYAGPL